MNMRLNLKVFVNLDAQFESLHLIFENIFHFLALHIFKAQLLPASVMALKCQYSHQPNPSNSHGSSEINIVTTCA